MYCCYYKCFQAEKINTAMACFIQNLRETPSCWGVWGHVGGFGGMLGARPVKIMILEVSFLLTNFDTTSAIFI